MKTVTVKKSKLLKTLKANKKTHEEEFDEVWAEFKRQAVHNFEERLKYLKTLKKGQQVNLYVDLDIPKNHSDDYKRAIKMLDWEVGDEVSLTEVEFSQFVQDDWSWRREFETSKAYYSSSR